MSGTAQHHDSESDNDDDDDVPSWVRDEWLLNSDIATLLAGLDEEEAQGALTVAGIRVNFASRAPAQRKEATKVRCGYGRKKMENYSLADRKRPSR